MHTLSDLLKNFFTHKDFLLPANEIAGTMFTPLHMVFAVISLAAVIFCALIVSKKNEKTIRAVFFVLWVLICVLEVTKIVWETVSGASVNVEVTGILPLYPCSVFMYAMPLAIFGHGKIRYMGCGYVCSLGLLGGSINFVYPATILGSYSCISFAGFHTFFYHGAMVFCAIVMLKSGYHSYKKAKKPTDLLLPAVPALAMSIVANAVNFSPIGSDYMFFKLSSFFFAPIGAALPTALCVAIVYILYLIIHALPYLPFYFKNKKASAL
ncbi:MAG: YwaF family protein [Clostridia bacterium]|nr:YwaF family protein [Clostridia bacterium]